jgi:hypothetical protein
MRSIVADCQTVKRSSTIEEFLNTTRAAPRLQNSRSPVFKEFHMSLRLSCVQIALVHSILLASALAMAGGEGFNGPVTSTVSIPVRVDHGISKHDVEATINTCLIAGDPARGLTSYFARVGQLLSGQSLTRKTNINTIIGPLKIEAKDHSFVATLLESYSGRDSQLSFTQFPLYESYKISDTEIGGTISGRNVWLEHIFRLPYLQFASTTGQPEYDELGDLVKDEELYNGLSIKVDPKLAQAGNMMGYKNGRTGHEIALKVNVSEYIECLKSELQQKAK